MQTAVRSTVAKAPPMQVHHPRLAVRAAMLADVLSLLALLNSYFACTFRQNKKTSRRRFFIELLIDAQPFCFLF
jgi:hypothetical protein